MDANIDILHIALLLIAFALIGLWWMEAREVRRLKRLVAEMGAAQYRNEFIRTFENTPHFLDKSGKSPEKDQETQ